MKIQITSDGMGYNVRLNAADPRDFGHLLNLFKLCVADNCRSYSNRVWRVEKRAQGQLSTFIGMAEDAGATIIRTTQQRAVVTLKEMAQAAQASAHTEILTISDTDESGAVLEYRARCKAKNLPAIVITRHARWSSFRGTVYGGAVDDRTKQRIFDYLLTASLGGGRIRVSNREVACSKISTGIAAEVAGWMRSHVAANFVAGDLHANEHRRLEARKDDIGRVRMIQGLMRRAA